MRKLILINRAILEDPELQRLYAERALIYTVATPIIVLKDGKAALIWLNEANSEKLKKIDELVQFRVDQIVKFYE